MHTLRPLVSTMITAGFVAMGSLAMAQTPTPNTTESTTTLPRATSEAQPALNSGNETTAQRMERERLERERLSATERTNTMNSNPGNNTLGTMPMRDANGNLVARADRN
jgi:hypothetical protein